MFQSLWYRARRLLISYEPVSEILQKNSSCGGKLSHKLRWRTSRKIKLKQCIQSIVVWLAFHFLSGVLYVWLISAWGIQFAFFLACTFTTKTVLKTGWWDHSHALPVWNLLRLHYCRLTTKHLLNNKSPAC